MVKVGKLKSNSTSTGPRDNNRHINFHSICYTFDESDININNLHELGFSIKLPSCFWGYYIEQLKFITTAECINSATREIILYNSHRLRYPVIWILKSIRVISRQQVSSGSNSIYQNTEIIF